jgi:hypothetical protein
VLVRVFVEMVLEEIMEAVVCAYNPPPEDEAVLPVTVLPAMLRLAD